MLDDGHVTDAKGRKINFKNTIIIMTSNIGSSVIQDYAKNHAASIGFKEEEARGQGAQETEMRSRVMEMMQDHFKPEFLNRIDEIIIFEALTAEQLTDIVDIQLELVAQRLAEQKITLEFSQAVKKHIAEKGYDQVYGARPLKRVIQHEILDPLALDIVVGNIKEKDTVKVDFKKDTVTFTKKRKTGSSKSSSSSKAKKKPPTKK